MVLVGLAVALLVWPPPRWRLNRLSVGLSDDRSSDEQAVSSADDPLSVAAMLDVFAVCLRAGLPVASAVGAVIDSSPADLRGQLLRTADLLTLGADPEHAWATTESDTVFDQLATLARRSARAGSSLAGGVAELADDTRQRAQDDAVAAAERAGVAISGPLGLCFLPAFVCLGIVPVVIGLAGNALGGL